MGRFYKLKTGYATDLAIILIDETYFPHCLIVAENMYFYFEKWEDIGIWVLGKWISQSTSVLVDISHIKNLQGWTITKTVPLEMGWEKGCLNPAAEGIFTANNDKDTS